METGLDSRDVVYKDRQYVLVGGEGWIDVRELTVRIVKTDTGVTVEVWPIETEGLSAERPLGRINVRQPTEVKRTGPKPKINIVTKGNKQ